MERPSVVVSGSWAVLRTGQQADARRYCDKLLQDVPTSLWNSTLLLA